MSPPSASPPAPEAAQPHSSDPERPPTAAPTTLPPLASALRSAWARGYNWQALRADLMAGAVVGVVALPLSMALAIACGVPPQYGIYTAIVAGGIIAILGGSPVQVSGPTAAFVVILAPIAEQFGFAGLLCATAFAGVLLIIMGLARLGRLIEFMPYPVTTGFTAGIAIVIATLQVRDFFGLQVAESSGPFLLRVAALAHALPTANWPDLSIGVVTLALLLIGPRLTQRIPPALWVLPFAASLAVLLPTVVPGATCATIASRFGGVPSALPHFALPWTLTADAPPLTFDAVRALLLSGVAIAMLGAIESLLSAVVGAGLSGSEHDPDAELVAQGIGNVVAPFFGGFAATGAIARTATNIRSGARSPLAAATHAVVLALGVLLAAPLLGYLPMASMAALLLVVAWNMSEFKHVVHMLRVAPRSDVVVLLTCLLLTVVFDMTVAVTAGVLLAALLFMKRMAAVTDVRLLDERLPGQVDPLPPHLLVYEVAGPLFFGAAVRAMHALRIVDRSVSVAVLDMRAVPVMDATGLVNLESALDKLCRQHVYTVVAGVQDQPLALMARAGWRHREWVSVYRSFDHGLAVARDLALMVTPGERGEPTAPVR